MLVVASHGQLLGSIKVVAYQKDMVLRANISDYAPKSDGVIPTESI